MKTFMIKQIYANAADFWARQGCQPVDHGTEEAISYQKALRLAADRLGVPLILLSATRIKKEPIAVECPACHEKSYGYNPYSGDPCPVCEYDPAIPIEEEQS